MDNYLKILDISLDLDEKISRFVSHQLYLLNLESIAENFDVENSDFKFCLSTITNGLFGRLILEFKISYKKSDPILFFSSGDIIVIYDQKDGNIWKKIATGIVVQVTKEFISISFDQDSKASFLEIDACYTLMKYNSDVTYSRMKSALKSLDRQSNERNSYLINVLFGQRSPRTINDNSNTENFKENDIKYLNPSLNEKQKEAVKFINSQRDIAILHGPPGTGKTTTLAESIFQHALKNYKVLVCAPSNIATDNLVEKLAHINETLKQKEKIKFVRLGHPARSMSHVHKYYIDAIIQESKYKDEIYEEIKSIKKNIHLTKDAHQKKRLINDYSSYMRIYRKMEENIFKDIITHSHVIICTLTSANKDGLLKYVNNEHFDVCFIDECTQAVEAACWIPLLQVTKCILAGDYNQLSPVIHSSEAEEGGLGYTLMERILKLHGDKIKKMLTLQYRMNSIIMEWPSKQLYSNQLEADISVEKHLLKDLPGVIENDDTNIPLLLIDTAGCDIYEIDDGEESKGNEGEADLAILHAENLIKSGVDTSCIAIITPYKFQIKLIKNKLSENYPKLEVSSIDGFQGREKDAIILSLVRSNDQGEIGFLCEDKRINVALTRAKRHLAVIANSDTISHHEFLKSFYDYCAEKGEIRTAFQYKDDLGLYPLKKEIKPFSEKREKHSKVNKACLSNRKVNTDNDIKGQEKKRLEEEKENILKSQKKEINKMKDDSNKFYLNEKYNKIIEEFLKSTEIELSFPPLSSLERRILEISEKFGLIHRSIGKEGERHIEIKKKIGTSVLTHNASSILTSELMTTDNKFEKCLEMDQNFKNNKDIEDNKDDYIIENNKQIDTVLDKTKSKKPKKKVHQKRKIKELKLENCATAENDDNFDQLIKQAIKFDNTCSFDKCKKSVCLCGQKCSFCSRMFCFSHLQAEIHGCGEAVRSAARKASIKAYKQSQQPCYSNRNAKGKDLSKKLKEALHKKCAKKC